MKVTIIGGGNMGSSIAKGLAEGSKVKAGDITVIDVIPEPLEALKSSNPEIKTVFGDYEGVSSADIVILAVKPWKVKDVMLDIKFQMDYSRQIIVSVATGITIKDMEQALHRHSEADQLPVIFRIIPNTAIAVKKSMTLVSTRNATTEQEQLLLSLFNELGTAVLLDEADLVAGTALTSCGIAYLFRYVRAAMQAGVELGFRPNQAQELVVHTMLGAAELLIATGNNPEVEVDKVTTPGGITIKGLNELEANGFSHAIVKAIKASR